MHLCGDFDGVLDGVGACCGVFLWCVGGLPLDVLQVPGGLLHLFGSVSKYKFFSPGIQVFLFFLDFGVFQNATWILRSTSGLRVTREGFGA